MENVKTAPAETRTKEQKKQVVDGTKQIRSKLEMRNYVNQIAEGGML